jgi:hypothetical protein
MPDLIKYNSKKSRVIFGMLIGVYIFFIALQSIGINLGVNLGVDSKKLFEGFEFYTSICKIVLMVYGCNEIYKDICTREDILSNSIPVSDIKRFFSKYLTYSLYYLIFQVLSIVFYFLNKQSTYNFLIDIVANYKEYIFHDIIGSLLIYPANIAIISTAAIIVYKLIRNQSVIAVLVVVVLILQVSVINTVYYKFFDEYSKPGIELVIDNRKASKNIERRFSYQESLPNSDGDTIATIGLDISIKRFVPMSIGRGQYGMTVSAPRDEVIQKINKYFKITSFSWVDVGYSIMCLLIALIISVLSIKWKGINN